MSYKSVSFEDYIVKKWKLAMFESIKQIIKNLDTNRISEKRLELLQSAVKAIRSEMKNRENVYLNFICTHNSRRSQFGQIWAAAMAAYFGLDNIFCYSGGTEATAFNLHAINALRSDGFKIETTQLNQENPVYTVAFSLNEALSLHCYSKVFSDQPVKLERFIALMTCSHAEEQCPFIPEAVARIPLDYEDPKVSDGTGLEMKIYKERSRQIALEMKYIFSSLL